MISKSFYYKILFKCSNILNFLHLNKCKEINSWNIITNICNEFISNIKIHV